MIPQTSNSCDAKPNFHAHDYADIFSVSLSIPILDTSAVNEPLRCSHSRTSKHNYSNIFGVLGEQDVAVPNEHLFSGKTKTRIPSSPFHDPGYVKSSELTERASGESDQSNVGVMQQQVNMSFSRIYQRNDNRSNGKTHVAQLHAVPGFTHFVDETPNLQKKDNESPVRSIKREVSCTWSLSSSAEPITDKGVLASEKSRIPVKPCNVKEINLKSHTSKVPPTLNHHSDTNNSKNIRQSALQSFASKDDSKKTDEEYCPPFLDEEVDENSIEAVSAASLKRAIDQAQESIRIAKMIMEKRTEGFKCGYKPRYKSCSKVKVKSNDVRASYEKLDPAAPVVTDVYEKYVLSLSGSKNSKIPGNTEVETVRENVEAAADHGDAFTEVPEKFAPFIEKKIEVKKAELNAEASEVQQKAAIFTGKIDNIDCSTCSKHKVESCMEQMETCKGTLEWSEPTAGRKFRINLTENNGVADDKDDEGVCMEKFTEMLKQPNLWKENQEKFESQVVASENLHISESDTIFSETREPFGLDLNYRVEEYHAADRDCKGNETGTFSDVEDIGVWKTNHQEVNRMPQTDSLPISASVEKLIESSTYKGYSSDLMDKDTEITFPKAEEMFRMDNEIRNAAKVYVSKINLPEFHAIDAVTKVCMSVDPLLERTSENFDEPSLTPDLENLKDNISNKEDGEDGVFGTSGVRENVERLHTKDQNGDFPSLSYCEPKETKKSIEAERVLGTRQKNEKKENDHKYETNERIEAIKRGREREKDKKAVERAIREARERAFAEARERAAVERAAAEARQREAREKPYVENKRPADKVSNEAKIRAERAAVERATTEARERALEKAMSQKTFAESRTQTQRSTSRNNGLKHSFSSSDLEKNDGASGESAQRFKARFERHQSIMERAAKALAEKNMRDVLAQKEQAERSRLAVSLDADIKRWATGKEGNLRALLSTLQYILGPESGWEPVSLTEMITTADVKKGYRKATLCVHPDKLQQRGATIQQKYICEKVFDLLKAAWNRFYSSEER